MNLINTYLFVPATRLDRVEKAFASGASQVIIDLEDAVELESKPAARAALVDFLKTVEPGKSLWVRLNAADTDQYPLDIEALKAVAGQLQGVFLPKTESAGQIEATHAALQRPVVAFVETARGILAIPEMCAVPGLYTLTFGCLDLANNLHAKADSEAMQSVYDHVRLQMRLHTALHQKADPIDTIYPHFNDLEGLAKRVAHWRDLGFSGMLCIHPKQVPVVQQVCAPSAEDIAWAERIVAHYQETGLAAFSLDGKMVDLPVIHWAQAVCAQAQK